MSYNFKSETEVKEFLKNLGIEYRFGCYSERNPEVCHLLGDYLEAIDKDYKKAAKLYQSNCDDYKYPRSCHKFGGYAVYGKGLPKKDIATGYKYFEKGCNLGYMDSCFNQGILLIKDENDSAIERNILKGMTLLEKACEGKNATACYYLSGMYISGVRKPNVAVSDAKLTEENTYLLQKNMEKAFKYAEIGCNLGNIYSCVNLSQMYQRGDGVQKNTELSDKYKKIAMEMQEEMQAQRSLTFQQGL